MNQVEALLHMLDSYDVSDRGVDVADVLSLPEPSMSDHIWQKLND